jgi:predicted phosphodiesterase
MRILSFCLQETLHTIRGWGIHVIAGNVEIQLFSGEDSCGCNVGNETLCDLLSRRWYAYTKKTVTTDNLEWMGTLPGFLKFKMGGRKILIVHGGLNTIAEHIYRSTPWERKDTQIKKADADIIIGGHCGLPFLDCHGDKAWINGGVLGMPANDGTPRVWYLTLQTETSGLQCTLHSLDYDFEKTARQMEEVRLPKEYIAAIRTGLWPDMSQLPDSEKKMQGKPLTFKPVLIK